MLARVVARLLFPIHTRIFSFGGFALQRGASTFLLLNETATYFLVSRANCARGPVFIDFHWLGTGPNQ